MTPFSMDEAIWIAEKGWRLARLAAKYPEENWPIVDHIWQAVLDFNDIFRDREEEQ